MERIKLNKPKSLFLAMFTFGCVLLAATAQAMTYTVTLTLLKDSEPVWTYTFTIEVEEEPVIIKVPEPLYQLIIEQFGTDTFITPFTIGLKDGFSLLVESDPSGLTIKFQPIQVGDINDDGITDMRDIITVARKFGTTIENSKYSLFADLNFDYSIDIIDLTTVAMDYGSFH